MNAPSSAWVCHLSAGIFVPSNSSPFRQMNSSTPYPNPNFPPEAHAWRSGMVSFPKDSGVPSDLKDRLLHLKARALLFRCGLRRIQRVCDDGEASSAVLMGTRQRAVVVAASLVFESVWQWPGVRRFRGFTWALLCLVVTLRRSVFEPAKRKPGRFGPCRPSKHNGYAYCNECSPHNRKGRSWNSGLIDYLPRGYGFPVSGY